MRLIAIGVAISCLLLYGAAGTCVHAQTKVLFKQTAVPEEEATTSSPDQFPVVVTNTDNEPVPVKIVSREDGVLLTLVRNAIPSKNRFFIDVREFRFASILGTSARLSLSSVDSTGESRVGIVLGFCSPASVSDDVTGLVCTTGPNSVETVAVFRLAGPFLEVHLTNAPDSAMTLKVFLQ